MIDATDNITREVSALKQMTVKQLRMRYAEVFGDTTHSGNKDWLWKRIAWRLQANAMGDLPERARRRAEELARDADLRMLRPRQMPLPTMNSHTEAQRVMFGKQVAEPMPSTLLTRPYKGKLIQVMVAKEGYIYQGRNYHSLSAITKEITGSHWNGNHFFKKALAGVSIHE